MIHRILSASLKRSYFLFGPRQTGKSTFVTSQAQENDLYITLLSQTTFLNYVRDPGLFRKEVLAHYEQHGKFTCIVDEVQKIPGLLNEVHDLIETYGIRFILTGSSARKLKRGAANLLAGRADTYQLYPLTYEELGKKFNLERALKIGCLPYLWSQEKGSKLEEKDQNRFLKSYADFYLREEIQAEGVVRNIAPFVRFLDIAANNDGEIVNYSNISRECGVSLKTVQEYYQILDDTFLAHRLDPWTKSVRKRLVAHPRYYFFDTGVTNALTHQYSILNPEVRGRRFEQFIILQLIALNAYHEYGFQFFFWRTNTGVKVDLIIAQGNQPIAALEIKSTSVLTNAHAHGLREFQSDYPDAKAYIIATIERPRLINEGLYALPWEIFLKEYLGKLGTRNA
jgi:predicted AAA+ superfamily ATPase